MELFAIRRLQAEASNQKPLVEMRKNRMLYLLGSHAPDAQASGKARFVAFSEIPQNAHYGLVANIQSSLAEKLEAFGLSSKREYDRLQGGWFRIAGIALPRNRFAYAQEFEHHPGEVELNLLVWRDVHVHREDFFAVQALFDVQPELTKLCDGPFLWR